MHNLHQFPAYFGFPGRGYICLSLIRTVAALANTNLSLDSNRRVMLSVALGGHQRRRDAAVGQHLSWGGRLLGGTHVENSEGDTT